MIDELSFERRHSAKLCVEISILREELIAERAHIRELQQFIDRIRELEAFIESLANDHMARVTVREWMRERKQK